MSSFGLIAPRIASEAARPSMSEGLAQEPDYKPTRAEEIRTRLADDIVKGRLPPGISLEEIALSRQFGVSRTPVREAIRQLEAMGLAKPRPRRGAVVALITRDTLDQMFAVMAELEAICARQSALHMTPAERSTLVAVHHSAEALVVRGDIPAYYEVNDAFHDAIYSGSHNDFLAEMTASVRQRVAPFRRAQFSSVGRVELSHLEHAEVVQAILARDGTAAAAAMLAHIHVVRGAFVSLNTGVGSAGEDRAPPP
jgi:DNA-binding GntR family transcriptional regulator